MKIEFDLKILPKGKQRYALGCETEGELIISKAEQSVFAYEEILLVEFACVLEDWLKLNNEGINGDFIYNSMDFEEEPVLAFKQQESGYFLIESALMEVPKDIFVNSDELIQSSKKFLQDLYYSLERKGVKFENYDAFDLPT